MVCASTFDSFDQSALFEHRETPLHERGGGGILYVGGDFTDRFQGDRPMGAIAVWDGSEWQAVDVGMTGNLGFGISTNVRDMCNFRGELVAVGDFTTSGAAATTTNGIALLSGGVWKAFGGGADGPGEVNACAVFKDELYVGGTFPDIDGIGQAQFAKWDDKTDPDNPVWVAVGTYPGGTVRTLLATDTLLFIGGEMLTPTRRLITWDGSSYGSVAGGLNFGVYDLSLKANGNVLVAGLFSSGLSPVLTLNRAAEYDVATDAYLALRNGLSALSRGCVEFGGSDYFCGDFSTEGGASPKTLRNIGFFDPTVWTEPDSGTGSRTDDLAEFEGDLIVCCGSTVRAGALTVNFIAKLTGGVFATMDQGFDNTTIDAFVLE